MGGFGPGSRTDPGQISDRHNGECRELVDGVTFADFGVLAKRNGWTIDDLAKEFRGGFGGEAGDPGFETSRHYFTRVFAGNPRPSSVIVWAPVVKKYIQAKRYSAIGDQVRRCACGCDRPVWGRKRTATPTCRKKLQRARDRERRLGLLQNGANRQAVPGTFL